MNEKPNYGIDSPRIITVLAVLGGAPLAISAVLFSFGSSHPGWTTVAAICLLVGAYFLAGTGGMLHYSKVGKLRIREELLSRISWSGHERVLDVGCGRGLLAVGAARRLTSGKAMGVDLWLRGALSGNGPEQVMENAQREGVADRVEATKSDVRQLPFAENSFDVVVSNFVLHELPTSAERKKMVREMVRVLKPGGQLLLVDFIFTAQCAQALREQGMDNVQRSRLGPLLGWILTAILNFGLVRTYLVAGHKPDFARLP
jgi:SAM-dependent methyltransferase